MHIPDEQSDEQLVRAYQSGNPEAFEILVRRYLSSIYRLAYRFNNNQHEAEDITQEVTLKLWKHLPSLDPTKSLKGWIFRVARNVCVDRLRKQKTVPFSTFDDDDGNNSLEESLTDPLPLADEQLDKQELSIAMKSALQSLPAQYRIVLSLRYDEGLKLSQIADSLEVPLETIKSQHRRAIILLRKNILGNPIFK